MDSYIDLSDTELYVTNLSWAESVEGELSSSLDNKMFLCSSSEGKCIKDTKNIKDKSIEEIITLEFDQLSDLEVLECQNLVIGTLRKNQVLDLQDFSKKISWLIDASKFLSNKLGLLLFQHKGSLSSITRSSYQFCNATHECEFNYNIKKKLGCYSQHYVHNLIYADLCALQAFVSKNNMNVVMNNEIQKSINTISYVINHMYDELQSANKFNFFNNKNNHIERNPKKNKKGLTSTC